MSNDHKMPLNLCKNDTSNHIVNWTEAASHAAGLLILLVGIGGFIATAVKASLYATQKNRNRAAQMEQLIDGQKLDVRVFRKQAPLGALIAWTLVGLLVVTALFVIAGLVTAGLQVLSESPYRRSGFRALFCKSEHYVP